MINRATAPGCRCQTGPTAELTPVPERTAEHLGGHHGGIMGPDTPDPSQGRRHPFNGFGFRQKGHDVTCTGLAVNDRVPVPIVVDPPLQSKVHGLVTWHRHRRHARPSRPGSSVRHQDGRS